MVNELLITFEDFKIYKDISANIRKDSINPYILQAQRMDLLPVLGSAFYYDLINKSIYPVGSPSDGTYNDLINGVIFSDGTNNIQYYGLKPIICYYAFARFINSNDFRVTKYGNTVKENEFSSSANNQVQKHVNNARSSALYYQDNLIYYLQKNSTTYTLWKQIVSNTRKAGVSIMASSGRRKNLEEGDHFRFDID